MLPAVGFRQSNSATILMPVTSARFVRHPGYLGWLIWATGMQLLLGNPVCLVATLAVVSLIQAFVYGEGAKPPWIDVMHVLV